jgi:hypothetical protein
MKPFEGFEGAALVRALEIRAPILMGRDTFGTF